MVLGLGMSATDLGARRVLVVLAAGGSDPAVGFAKVLNDGGHVLIFASMAAGAVVEIIALTLMPLVMGIAILRYRLCEIDRIISRTVSYGLLTAILVAVYAALIVVRQRLLAPVTGQSDLAVAGATLAVAALFSPLRQGVQPAVDRRFHRARYDAEQTLVAFRRRLRHEVDLDDLHADLLTTVGATVHPSNASLWLQIPEQRS